MFEIIKSLFNKKTKKVIAPELSKDFVILKQMVYSQLCRNEDYRIRGAMVDYYIEGNSHTLTAVFPHILDGICIDWKVNKPSYITKYIEEDSYALAMAVSKMIIEEAMNELKEAEEEE